MDKSSNVWPSHKKRTLHSEYTTRKLSLLSKQYIYIDSVFTSLCWHFGQSINKILWALVYLTSFVSHKMCCINQVLNKLR